MLPSTLRQGKAGPSQWPRCRLVLVCATIALLLSGCVVRVVYNQLDWLTLWYIDDYFDLDAAQKAEASALIGRTLAWHRTTQLPRYATLSRAIHDRVGAPMSADFIAACYEETVELLDQLLRQVAADAGALLPLLSDRQVDELFERIQEDNLEFEEDYSGDTAAERRAKRDKAIIRMFRRFTGRLDAAQESLIRSRAAQLHDLSGEWLHRRTAWQAEFRRLLEGRKSDSQFGPRLADLMLDPNQFDSPDYRNLVLDNQRQVFSLVAEVLGTLTPAQNDVLRKRLAGYTEDFDALVREGANPQEKTVSREVSRRRGAEERT